MKIIPLICFKNWPMPYLIPILPSVVTKRNGQMFVVNTVLVSGTDYMNACLRHSYSLIH